MILKYRTTKWGLEIKAMQVEKETDKSVFCRYDGMIHEEEKESDYHRWFNSWDDAHQFLLERQAGKIDALQIDIERAEADLEQIRQMKEQNE